MGTTGVKSGIIEVGVRLVFGARLKRWLVAAVARCSNPLYRAVPRFAAIIRARGRLYRVGTQGRRIRVMKTLYRVLRVRF